MMFNRVAMAAAVAAAGLTGLVFSISASQPESTTLVLHQDPPHLVTKRIQDSDSTVGDLMLFDAPFASEDGSKTGTLTGSLLVVEMPDRAAEGAEVVQSRLTNLVFNFEGEGTIVVSGSAVYPVDSAKEMVANHPQVRAVVGGTGEFIGASGELSTVRSEDGSYTHEFTLLN